MPGAVQIAGECAAGADLLDIRHAEAEQGRQRAEGLGQADEGVLAEDGGFPDEAVAAGRQQGEEGEQGAGHRQQP